MAKKKTMGSNPLEAYLGATEEPKQEVKETVVEKEVKPRQPVRNETVTNLSMFVESTKKKQRITIHLPIDLIERVKNAVYWEAGLTLTGFAEYAFEQALAQQEKKRGSAYPERKERTLKSGRPVV